MHFHSFLIFSYFFLSNLKLNDIFNSFYSFVTNFNCFYVCLAMDKEDALIVFEDHIRLLEKDDVEEKEQEKKRLKRQARKNRDQFLVLLDSLHEEGKLTSMSLWIELYPIISADIRFSAMLGKRK